MQLHSQDFSLELGVGREKALASAGHMITKHLSILGVINYHILNICSYLLSQKFKMAVSSSELGYLSVLGRVGFSLNNGNFPCLNLKPLQMECVEYILKGQGSLFTSCTTSAVTPRSFKTSS